MRERNARLEALILNNATVKTILFAGGDTVDALEALHAQNKGLMQRIERLESIAPQKMRAPDGKVYIWRCPDELVPEVT